MRKYSYFELLTIFYESVFQQLNTGMPLEQAIEKAKTNFWNIDDFYSLLIGISYFKLKFYRNVDFTSEDIEMYTELKKYALIVSPDLEKNESEHLAESIANLDSWMFSTK